MPETDAASSKASAPVRKNFISFTERFETAPPAPKLPPRGPGSFWAITMVESTNKNAHATNQRTQADPGFRVAILIAVPFPQARAHVGQRKRGAWSELKMNAGS